MSSIIRDNKCISKVLDLFIEKEDYTCASSELGKYFKGKS